VNSVALSSADGVDLSNGIKPGGSKRGGSGTPKSSQETEPNMDGIVEYRSKSFGMSKSPAPRMSIVNGSLSYLRKRSRASNERDKNIPMSSSSCPACVPTFSPSVIGTSLSVQSTLLSCTSDPYCAVSSSSQVCVVRRFFDLERSPANRKRSGGPGLSEAMVATGLVGECDTTSATVDGASAT
jgi:hypothetical protein